MLRPLMFALTLAGVLFANVSFGHAKLVSSSPANGAKVSESPSTLTLSFNEEVKLSALTLTLAGNPVPVTIDKAAAPAKIVVVPVSALAPGVYELHWTAVSTDDGHVTKGSFSFLVLGAAPAH
jgi:methionine-rich copper-binding protein CopC